MHPSIVGRTCLLSEWRGSHACLYWEAQQRRVDRRCQLAEQGSQCWQQLLQSALVLVQQCKAPARQHTRRHILIFSTWVYSKEPPIFFMHSQSVRHAPSLAVHMVGEGPLHANSKHSLSKTFWLLDPAHEGLRTTAQGTRPGGLSTLQRQPQRTRAAGNAAAAPAGAPAPGRPPADTAAPPAVSTFILLTLRIIKWWEVLCSASCCSEARCWHTGHLIGTIRI
jgi:hypothetical protein